MVVDCIIETVRYNVWGSLNIIIQHYLAIVDLL
jgi:hypothetical protein